MAIPTTDILALPLLDDSQAQKATVHNLALLTLDVVINLSVISHTITAPPVAPSSGDRYIVPAGASGFWANQTNAIAAWRSGAWTFYTPREGWRSWVASESQQYVFTQGAWEVLTGGIQSISTPAGGTKSGQSVSLALSDFDGATTESVAAASAAAAAAQTTANAAVPTSQLGAASGVAQLDANSTLKASQIPSSLSNAVSSAQTAASNAIPLSYINAPNGVLGLDATGYVAAASIGRSGVIHPTRPPISQFSTVYGMAATSPPAAMSFTDQGDSYLLSITNAPKSGSTTANAQLFGGYFKPIGSTTTTIIACFEADFVGSSGQSSYGSFGCGVAALNTTMGSAGKGGEGELYGFTTQNQLGAIAFTDPNTSFASGGNFGIGAAIGRIWVKVAALTSGTRQMFLSSNGRDWNPLEQFVSSVGGSWTHVGFVLYSFPNSGSWTTSVLACTQPVNARLIHFAES